MYDATEVQTQIATHPDEPEFHEPFACKFYKGVVGDISNYGEEAYVLLTSLAEKKTYDEQDYKLKLKDFFSSAKYEKVGEFSSPFKSNCAAMQIFGRRQPTRRLSQQVDPSLHRD